MLEQALIIALIILFLHALTWPGMIFSDIKRLNLPDWIAKPLYSCPVCMAPWWGTLLYWLIFRGTVTAWLLTVAVASGFSVISIILIAIRNYCVKQSGD